MKAFSGGFAPTGEMETLCVTGVYPAVKTLDVVNAERKAAQEEEARKKAEEERKKAEADATPTPTPSPSPTAAPINP
jgi:hypothetical protein